MNEGDSQTVPVDNTYREVVVHGNREFQRLIFPPVPRPRRILECGSGSGAWAMEVAEQYPECEVGEITPVGVALVLLVIGIDVYPYPVPEDIPPNLDFQVDDLNSPRMMAGGIHANRWMNYLSDILRVLRPGGWCQMVEIYFNAQSDNGTLTSNHALQVWSQNYMQSIQPAKDPRAPLRLQNWMTQAGFVEVESRLLTLPLSGWSTDPRDNAIGMANQANVHRLMSSLSAFPFSHALNMTNADIQLLIAQARSEADNPAFKLTMQFSSGLWSPRHAAMLAANRSGDGRCLCL
ncbi:hypothetical protein CHGG_04795 [Chaetomium globosum CBS 148.51]|uniref:Methyltransferase domain-containing protein n=1 Tax=Chaetomium globosum (strain ATCC 6205 / CBS 148.51 / DSM 1962 / NBRC 6347 / NRRL 1970) TaxID=306901 RepID=Q2H0A1_CHAGB|nr:uncharacterized protein CHGG_04795 [Chaetomium globosum CBS 148.51]EAQ88176.1 hypothetical protein CHGG_04795 [Chaetomium globosum CBS 148.51]